MPVTIRGLTLWEPWSWAVAHAGKRVENRPWAPPPAMFDHLIAIHSGLKLDGDASRALRHVFNLDTPREYPHGSIVAVARLAGLVHQPGGPETRKVLVAPPLLCWDRHWRWFGGPYGWVLDPVVPIEPVPGVRGRQRLWKLDPAVEAVVLERFAAAGGSLR